MATNKKNPRRINNAGELIGKALAPKELAVLMKLVQRAQKEPSDPAEALTLSLILGKLKKAFDWKALNTRSHGL